MKYFFLFLINASILSATTLDDVLKSSIMHYPKVKMALINQEISYLKATKAQGQFDSKLIGSSRQRTDGYYDGDTGLIKLSRQFGVLNSKLEAGYRESNGSLPVYELQDETLDEGEYFVEASFSLLRDAMTDIDRLMIKNSEIDKVIAKVEAKMTMLSTLKYAEIAYYNYVVALLKKDIYQSLLDLSLKQHKDIKKRAQRGDLARIYITENLQYIAKRRNKLTEAVQTLNIAKYNLSLLYRDKDGKPLLAKNDDINRKININSDTYSLEKMLSSLYKRNLEFSLFQKIIDKIDNEINFKESQTLPLLDLKVSSTSDRGEGLERLEGEEQKIMINLEIPLERRKIDSDLSISKMYKKNIQTKLSFFKDQLKNKLSTLNVKLTNLTKLIEITNNEIKYAETLEKAERTKFSNGDSDLILLNIREQNTVDAKLKLLDYKLKYLISNSKLKEIISDKSYLSYLDQ